DAGFPGLVVTLAPDAFGAVDLGEGDLGEGDLGQGEVVSAGGAVVSAGGAVYLPVLARQTAAAGLTGLEWAVGVPGSVGGAVRMNAGGHGADTSRTLISARWLDLAAGPDAEVAEVAAAGLELGYRTSRVTDHHLVLAASY